MAVVLGDITEKKIRTFLAFTTYFVFLSLGFYKRGINLN